MTQPRTSLIIIFGDSDNIKYYRKLARINGDFTVEPNELSAIKKVAREIQESASDDLVVVSDAMATLKQMLEDFAPQTVTTERYAPMKGFPPYTVECPQGMVGRVIRATNRNNRDKDYNNTMLVSVSAILEWCAKKRINYRALRGSLIKVGAILDGDKRFTISKGTTITMPQQRCWLLDLKKIQGENDEPTQD